MLLYAFEAAVQTIFWAWLLSDDKDLKDQICATLLSAIVGGVPFVRDAAGVFQGYSGGGVNGSVPETPGRVFNQVKQGQNDKALRRAVGDAIGLATGLASTESLRVIEAAIECEDTGNLPIADMLFGRNPLSR